MKTSSKERQRKWRQKQISRGMQPVTVMLPAEIKDMIDRKRKETGATIGQIVETALVKLFNPSDGTTANIVKAAFDQNYLKKSASKIRQLCQDLEAVAARIEEGGQSDAAVTCDENPVTNDAPAPAAAETNDVLTREIYRLVRLLNNMEVRPDEIAATLNKRKLKTLNGAYEWRESDVCAVLQDIQQKYGHINPLFSISDHF